MLCASKKRPNERTPNEWEARTHLETCIYGVESPPILRLCQGIAVEESTKRKEKARDKHKMKWEIIRREKKQTSWCLRWVLSRELNHGVASEVGRTTIRHQSTSGNTSNSWSNAFNYLYICMCAPTDIRQRPDLKRPNSSGIPCQCFSGVQMGGWFVI